MHYVTKIIATIVFIAQVVILILWDYIITSFDEYESEIKLAFLVLFGSSLLLFLFIALCGYYCYASAFYPDTKENRQSPQLYQNH